MKSPLFSVIDVAAQAGINRERRKQKRRDTYEYCTHLSSNISPFKKPFKSPKRRIKQGLPCNDIYSQLRHPSSFTKPSTPGGEVLNFEFSDQKELADEYDDEFDLDQNSSSSPTTDEQLDSIHINDKNQDAILASEVEHVLHPYTHVSINSALIDFLQLVRHSQISKKEAEQSLLFIRSILPFPNRMPKDMNTLLKRLNVVDYFTKRTICILCKDEVPKNRSTCDKCIQSEKKYIAHILDTDIRTLLSSIILRLSPHIERYKKVILSPDPQTKYDIPFGKIYQCLLKKHPNENLLSLLLHVDGIGLAKSAKLKLWICNASIVELPPNLRSRRSNMFLLSMYIGYSQPDVTAWLKPCFLSLNVLKNADFQVAGVQQSYNIKIYGCIGDCPALKLMTNIIGHNGYYSCFYCHIHGVHVRKPRKRQYYYASTINYRTVNSFHNNSREAQLSNKNVFGHLGISILEEVLDVPLPHGIVIDYAHVSLLRHFRDVTRTVALSLAPAARQKIDYSLRTQVFPHFFHRKMRGIEDFSFIKAMELKNLLLYGFIPHFMHYLTIDQLCFLSLLIIGIRLLHADNVFTPVTGTTANNLLCRYYADHHLYFFRHANLVLHFHQHFQKIYEYHGPLSSVNTFAQEDFIGYISKNKNGTTSFHNLLAYYYNIDVLLTNFKEKNVCMIDGPLDLFLLVRNDPLSNELFDYHQHICGCNNYNTCIKTYRRCCVSKQIFHSLHYIRRGNTISYFVQYFSRLNQIEFGIIRVFFQHHGQIFAIIQNFQVGNAFSDYLKDSRYYVLLKQPIDKFYFVLKKTNINRIVSSEKIQKHLIIFESVLADSFVLATPVSSLTEHD